MACFGLVTVVSTQRSIAISLLLVRDILKCNVASTHNANVASACLQQYQHLLKGVADCIRGLLFAVACVCIGRDDDTAAESTIPTIRLQLGPGQFHAMVAVMDNLTNYR